MVIRFTGAFAPALLMAAVTLLTPVAASATLLLATTQTSDAAFEGANGFLQTEYGLPLVGNTALPPAERAVGEVRIGSAGSRTQGFHVPTPAPGGSGLPGVGAGVTTALTNFNPVGGGAQTSWVSGTPVNFSLARTGTTVTYTVGANSWSSTASYFADINSVEFRVRTDPSKINTLTIDNLAFTDAATLNQALSDVSGSDGGLLIKLWTDIRGDFSLTGRYTFSWTGAKPSGSAQAAQIKLLDLPFTPPLPEPGSWALLIAGFGFVGATMRRQRAALA